MPSRSRSTAAALAALLLSGACAGPARELHRGGAPPRAAATAVDALAARFGPVEREERFDTLRPKLARGALVPSRVFDDPEAWTSRGEGWRAVEFVGYGTSAAYHVGVRSSGGEPVQAGEYHGRLRLQQTGSGRYHWDVREELAIGRLPVSALAAALDALLRAADAGDAASTRATLHASLPRATEQASRALRLETLALLRESAGTVVELGVRVVPDALSPFAPRYARFLRRYVLPMQLQASARDEAGATWWTLRAAQGLWTLRLRVRGGSLAPLEGPADRRIPERLRVLVDYETRMNRFRVGARQLAAELTLVRTPNEKGFVARFAREPEWILPFLVAPLLRGSLQHPFEPPGSEAGWSAIERGSRSTVLVRHYRARVRESWILRWLGGMTSTAVEVFRRGAEAEADRFHRECLLALRDDLAALERGD